MGTNTPSSPFQWAGTALLRAASLPVTAVPSRWPETTSETDCTAWLTQVWTGPFAEAVRDASPQLGERLDEIVAGAQINARRIRKATESVIRYLQRATARPTPFGVFAGVATVNQARNAAVLWGSQHQPVSRPDAQWVADVIAWLEAMPDVLDRLDVQFSNLAVQRGSRLDIPGGTRRVSIGLSPHLTFIQKQALDPIRFADLVDRTVAAGHGGATSVRRVLTQLVASGYLITSLRAPNTEPDQLGHLLRTLDCSGAASAAEAAPLVRELRVVALRVGGPDQSGSVRAETRRLMRAVSPAGRVPLAVDLLLDCRVSIPARVVRDAERAAAALARLSGQPTGVEAWRTYCEMFWERYGTGCLVPLLEAVDPASGIGLPPTYPGSTLPEPVRATSGRDERLLALALTALATGERDIDLTDEMIAQISGRDAAADVERLPPSVELGVRLEAASTAAVDRGDYRLVVSPARAAGTLTARFTVTRAGSGLEEVYRGVPTITEGALPAQLSFPALYAHTENISRIPAYLPHVIPLGEHRPVSDPAELIPLDDLALTATHDGLHLVSVSRRRIVEPQMFHAMALEKQAPPLARFLTNLPRAATAHWTRLDWGPAASRLPYLPQVRHGRAVLSEERWLVTAADLADEEKWRTRWAAPDIVEAREDNRSLRLDLRVPSHIALLRRHIARAGEAVLTRAPDETALGWIGGHAHEIALPLMRATPGRPNPLKGRLPVVTSSGHGQLAGSQGVEWINAKVFTHPDAFEEIIRDWLPRLSEHLFGDPDLWFIRYRSPREREHLRIRIRARSVTDAHPASLAVWAQQLRDSWLASDLVLDTYRPEVGRYGTGTAMKAAEAVFCADSLVVGEQMRVLHRSMVDPLEAVVFNMTHIARGFLGDKEGMAWLADRRVPGSRPAQGDLAARAVVSAQGDSFAGVTGWQARMGDLWAQRASALARYRGVLRDGTDVDAVLESLLHMHFNRAIGMDRDLERDWRRVARFAGLAGQARR